MNTESDDNIAPCPYCGGKCVKNMNDDGSLRIVCLNCMYESRSTYDEIDDGTADDMCDIIEKHNALTENAAKLETIAQYVLNVLNDSATDSLPEWWTPHTVATTINRIITAAPHQPQPMLC